MAVLQSARLRPRRDVAASVSDLPPGRPGRAIAALYAPETPARIRCAVDLSRPESTSRIVVGFEDCDRVPSITDLVDACDLLAGEEATAEVVGIDERECVIRIAVDWTTIRKAAS